MTVIQNLQMIHTTILSLYTNLQDIRKMNIIDLELFIY
nr:MAG TPA: hypothetical protein [Bacteriophage sp.]